MDSPTYRMLDEIPRWIFTALLALLPFFFVPAVWIATAQAKLLLTAVLVIVAALSWAAARFLEGKVHVPWAALIPAAVLLPIVYALSAAVTGMQPISLLGSGVEPDTLVSITVGSGILLLAAFAFTGKALLVRRAVLALFSGSIALMLLQILHIAFPSLALGGVFTSETSNAFGSWHEFSIFAGAIFFLGLAEATRPSFHGRARYLVYAAAVLSFLMLVLTNFFDVWLALAAVCAVLVAARGYEAQGLRSLAFWRREWLGVAAVVVAVLFALFGSYVMNALPERIRAIHVEVRPSWQGTLDIARNTLTTPRSLFFGTGPNTFTREWGLHKPLDVNQTIFWNVDFATGVASVATALITAGLFGAAAWVLFLLALLVTGWKATLGRARVVPFAATLALVTLYLAAFFAFSVPGTVLAVLTFLLAGLTVALRSEQVPVKSFAMQGWIGVRTVHAVVLALVTLLLIVAAGSMARALTGEIMLNQAIARYNASGDIAASSALVQKAIGIYPSDRAHRAAVQLGLLQLQQLVQSADPSQAEVQAQLQSTLQATIQHGTQAVALNGGYYQNWIELAAIYAELAGANVEGAYVSARAAYERAAAESPTSPVPLMNLARLELIQNQPDNALQYLAKAIELKPDFAAAYYLASQIYAARGDFQSALQSAGFTIQYAQDDPQSWYNYAAIAYAAEQFNDAAVAAEQALARQSQFANALYVLGLAYYELDRTADAIAVFEALDQLDPGQEIVTTVLENLRAGEAPLPKQTARGSAGR